MVVATDVSPLADVVFVIEGTANLGAYLDQGEGLKTNYIIPTLEYFNGGSSDDRDNGLDCSSTMFALVVFMAADCAPEPAVSCYAQTSSIKRFLGWLDQIPFVGGAGEGNSHIAEGLSTAIQVFDDFQAQREPNVTTQKHCVLICNSPPYPLPCLESQNYSGFMADQLASLMGERGINLTIISPRKIPALLKLYDKAGGDLQVMLTKNYAKDRRHLILLRGFQLQERPLSPSAECIKPKPNTLPMETKPGLMPGNSSVPGGSPVAAVNVMSPQPSKKRPPNGSPPNAPPFKQPVSSQPTSISGQPPLTTGPNAVSQNSNAGNIPITMQQRSSSSTMPPQSINRQGAVPASQSPASFINQPNPPNVTINNKVLPPGVQLMPDSGPASTGNTRPGREQSPINVGGKMPWSTNIVPPTSTGPTVSHLLNQLSRPPIPSGGGAIQNLNRNPVGPPPLPSSGSVSTVGIVNHPTVVGQQPPNLGQLNILPNSTQGGPFQPLSSSIAQSQTSQSQSQQGPPNQQNVSISNLFSNQVPSNMPQSINQTSGSMTMPSQVSSGQGTPGTVVTSASGLGGPGMQKERRNIWNGFLEWQEKSKNPSDPNQKLTRTLPCHVSSNITATGEIEVNADRWPKKLIMQLIPRQMVSSFGPFLKNSRNVIFTFNGNIETLETLTKVMTTGFAGCVHFTQIQQCDIRVMILLYSPEKQAYIGFIPNDQTGLVSAIRSTITNHKKQQLAKTQPIHQPPQQQPSQTSIFSSSTLPGQQQSMTGLNPNISLTTSSGPGLGQQPGLLITQSTGNASGGTTTINMVGSQPQPPPQQPPQPQQPNQQNSIEMERAQNLLKIQQLEQTLAEAQQKELQLKAAQEKVALVRQQIHQQHRILQTPSSGGNNPQLRHLLQHQQQQQQLRQQQILLQQQTHRPQLPPGQINQSNMAAIAAVTSNLMQPQQSNSSGRLFADDSFLGDMS